MTSKTITEEQLSTMQKKYKDQAELIQSLKKQTDEAKQSQVFAESKLKATNEMHSQKVKALLKSINLLKKEVQKVKYESKDNVRQQKNERLSEDIKLQDLAITALRKIVADEDKCNLAIKRELEKGPARVRVLSREELKIEIKKYKNMSLRIVQDMKKQGQKVPGYASNLAKEKEAEVGLKEEKSEQENYDGNSLFDVKSEVPEDLPEKVTLKLSKQEDTIARLNQEVNEKNEKFLELLTELDEIKVQVYARDKSIELQQKQIDELLEELRIAKGHENNVKRLTQKNMALSEEIERLRLEMQSHKMKGFQKEDEQVELSMVKLDMNNEL